MASRTRKQVKQPQRPASTETQLTPGVQPVFQRIPPIEGLQGQNVQVVGQFYQGPIPPPEALSQYEDALPGAADRIIRMSETEVEHRRELERLATEANIAAQKQQLAIAELQVRSVFMSDKIGQIFGALLSAGAIAGAVYCAINDHGGFASALVSLPIVAIIRALRHNPGQSVKAPNKKPSPTKDTP